MFPFGLGSLSISFPAYFNFGSKSRNFHMGWRKASISHKNLSFRQREERATRNPILIFKCDSSSYLIRNDRLTLKSFLAYFNFRSKSRNFHMGNRKPYKSQETLSFRQREERATRNLLVRFRFVPHSE